MSLPDPVDPNAEAVLLPDFVRQRDDGLYLDAGEAGNPANILKFINRVYGSNAYLAGLDYTVLQGLLYPRWASDQRMPPPLVQRLAESVRPFPPERQSLYKNIKISDGGARVEYVFEPVQIERTVEVPIFGVDDDGNTIRKGSFSETEIEPTTLNVDEFVAALWQKGIRCGVDVQGVANTLKAMNKKDTFRTDVAHRVAPSPGSDATLIEQTEALHRDDTPRILPNGKIDLRQFTNRFPQITAGMQLLKKESRRLGAPGYELSGERIEPELPRDFSLDELAGTGTRIERTAAGEFIVAARDGFLNIDTDSGQISVSEKIINKTGISIRTTGDLSLTGDVFEEHGEVQEKRVVEGLHMTFLADVFGSINSLGGNVHCASNLVGGRVSNPRGHVRVDQRCSNAIIEARGGTITLAQAEGCTLMAASVTIDSAVGCCIVADDITIKQAVATALIGRRITLGSVAARREISSVVSLAVPDFTQLDRRISDSRELVADIEARLAAAANQRETLMSDPGLRSYLATDAGIRSGKIKLNSAQEAQLQQLALKFGKAIQTLRDIARRSEQLSEQLASSKQELAAQLNERQHSAEALFVKVAGISGDTLIRTVKSIQGGQLMPGVSPNDLRTRLRDPAITCEKLADLDAGSFSWSYVTGQ